MKQLMAPVVAVLFATGALASSAAPGWVLVTPPAPPSERSGHAMAYDPIRQRVVLFGGENSHGSELNDTWEWDGTHWSRALPVTSPPARHDHALAFDGSRIILYGGVGSTALPSDTWAWDGSDWVELHPAHFPIPNRWQHAMAHDASRGRIVMFGGYNYVQQLQDTWTWDGSDWHNVSPGVGPGPRKNHAMAYDAPRQRILLYGGEDVGALGDTWEWNGASALWTELHPLQSPGPRVGHSMTGIASGVLLYGSSTWEWDGTTWTLKSSAGPQSPTGSIVNHAASGRVLFSGNVLDFYAARKPPLSTWEWDGNAWGERTPIDPSPGIQEYLGDRQIVYAESSRRILGFNGLGEGLASPRGDLWSWTGTTWSLLPTNGNPMFTSPTNTYDSNLNLVVAFGGRSQSGSVVSDLWQWNGEGWQQPAAATAPPARSAHTIVYDAARRETVLFGGYVGFAPGGYADREQRDTWVWNGSQWTLRVVGQYAESRTNVAMAYDPVRQRVLRFGGCHKPENPESCVTGTTDTWEWDGVSWTYRTPAVSPPGRYGASIAYDRSRSRIVLFGGRNAGAYLTDMWEWDGTNWTQRAAPPVTPSGTALEYDARRQRLVLFDRQQTTQAYGPQTWEFAPIDTCGITREVVAFAPGSGTGDASAAAILGPADGTAVSLGLGGSVTLRIDPIVDAPGTDAIVRELGAAEGEIDENYIVEASVDGTQYRRAGVCGGGRCVIDLGLADLASASYLRVVDLAPQEAGTSAPRLGADIDAVELLHCVPEVCDDLDDDGDGEVDEGCNLDHDGACGVDRIVIGTPATCPLGASDCDEYSAQVFPGAAQACDGLNNDCMDPAFPNPPPNELDRDGDGLYVCQGDCDDTNPNVRPGAPEVCDGLNDDCTDPGYPAPPADELDQDGDGYYSCQGDCDDLDPARHPGAPDWCNGIDDDCDGVWDEAQNIPFYVDNDGDGWGGTLIVYDCAQPNGSSTRTGDCNDANPAIYPDAADACNDGVDANCDGRDGSGFDTDHDGLPSNCDNCPFVENANQQDTDFDGDGDACDNCLTTANPGQENSDTDELGDACDNCPAASNYQEDFDVDGVGDACDNCPAERNASQADADADHEGDECDFDDGLIRQFRTEPGWIEWRLETNYSTYNVYEGDLAVLRSSGVYSQQPGSNPLAQRSCGLTDAFVEDAENPPSGSVSFNLVSGVAAGVEGSLGTDSHGVPRPNAHPCP